MRSATRSTLLLCHRCPLRQSAPSTGSSSLRARWCALPRCLRRRCAQPTLNQLQPRCPTGLGHNHSHAQQAAVGEEQDRREARVECVCVVCVVCAHTLLPTLLSRPRIASAGLPTTRSGCGAGYELAWDRRRRTGSLPRVRTRNARIRRGWCTRVRRSQAEKERKTGGALRHRRGGWRTRSRTATTSPQQAATPHEGFRGRKVASHPRPRSRSPRSACA